MAKTFGRSVVRLIGQSGNGKTKAPQFYAEETGRKFHKVSCHRISEPAEFFGTAELVDGNTGFAERPLIALLQEGSAIILFDEVNRAQPWIANALLEILDDSDGMWIENDFITFGDDIIFVMTMNEGGEFTGTFEIDMALVNRADAHIRVGYLPADIETELLVRLTDIREDASQVIVEAMNNLRGVSPIGGSTATNVDVDVTTRASTRVARLVASGLSLLDAFNYVIFNAMTSSNNAVVSAVQHKLMNYKVTPELVCILAKSVKGKETAAIQVIKDVINGCTTTQARKFVNKTAEFGLDNEQFGELRSRLKELDTGFRLTTR